MAGRPAPLEGSLLARKGDATPVIPQDSPLMESVEGATSDVVPLHRVASPEPAQPAVAPPVVEAAPVSPHRRAAIILVVLLVAFLVAVALAVHGNRAGPESRPARAAESRSIVAPVSAPSAAAPVPVPETATSEVAPPEAASPDTPPAEIAAAAAPPAVESSPPRLKMPETVTPVSPAATGKKLYVLQFASVRAEDRALQEAARLQKRLGGVLGARKIVVVGTEVGGQQRYRLRAGSFDSLRAAISACRNIARLKVECLPIRR